MSACNYCDQEMTLGASCTLTAYDDFPDGVVRDRLPLTVGRADPSGKCHDCAAPVGGFHHPGCDDERCPKCQGQAISCGCTRDEDDDDR